MSGWQEINIVFRNCGVSRELGINSIQVENSIFSGLKTEGNKDSGNNSSCSVLFKE